MKPLILVVVTLLLLKDEILILGDVEPLPIYLLPFAYCVEEKLAIQKLDADHLCQETNLMVAKNCLTKTVKDLPPSVSMKNLKEWLEDTINEVLDPDMEKSCMDFYVTLIGGICMDMVEPTLLRNDDTEQFQGLPQVKTCEDEKRLEERLDRCKMILAGPWRKELKVEYESNKEDTKHSTLGIKCQLIKKKTERRRLLQRSNEPKDKKHKKKKPRRRDKNNKRGLFSKGPIITKVKKKPAPHA